MPETSLYAIRITGGVDSGVLTSLNDFKERVLGAQESALNFAKTAGEFLFIYEGAKHLVEFGLEALKAADEMKKFSAQVGIGVEDLSKLKFAADLSGAGDQFRTGMIKFSEAIGQSADQGSKAAQVFQAIGISTRDMDGNLRPTVDILKDVANKFAGWADGANKATIAAQLFGTRNVQFVTMLDQGAAGLQAYGDELERIGGVFTDQAAEKAEQFNDSLTMLKAASTGVALTVGTALVPSITEFIREVVLAATGTNDWKTALENLNSIVSRLVIPFTLLTQSAAQAVDQLVTLASIADKLNNSPILRAGIFGPITNLLWPGKGNESVGSAIDGTLEKLGQLSDRTAERWDKSIEKLKEFAGLVNSATGKPESSKPPEGSKLQAPSVFGQEMGAQDTINALKEDLQLQEQELSIRRAIAEADYSKTDWEKRQAAVDLLKQQIRYTDDYLADLRKMRDLETDKKSRDQFDAAIRQGETQRGRLGVQLQTRGGQPDANSISEQMTAAMTRLRQQFGTVAMNIAEGFTNVIGNAVQSVSNGITQLIMGTKTWGQALMEIGTSILESIVQAIVQMGVRWVATQIMMAVAGKAIMAGTTAAAAPIAAAQSAIWAAPATLATISSYGAAAAAAPGFIAASEASTMAMSVASFAEGGFTGMVPADQIAGLVHGREYVMPADMTSKYFSTLEQMRQGSYQPGRPASSGGSGHQSGQSSSHTIFIADGTSRQAQREAQRRGSSYTVEQLRKRGLKIG